MSLPANDQRVIPADWVYTGGPSKALLSVRFPDGDEDWLSVGDLARRFGRHDAELRRCSWRWCDEAGEDVDVREFGDAALVNTTSGVSIPVALAPRLLGCEVGAAGIAAVLGTAQATPLAMLAASAPLSAGPASYYTSKPGGPHPPGKSQRWSVRNLQRYGAKKVDRDWVVSVADYDRARAEEDARRCAAQSAPAKAVKESAVEVAKRGLAKIDYRPTKEAPDA